ncbi:MAG: CHAP domain-containing protein [Sandaracinaceae bacterium]
MRSRRKRWVWLGVLAAVVLSSGTPALNRAVRWAGETAGLPSPVLPAPLFDVLRPAATFQASTPANPATERAMATLARVDRRLRHTRYQHRTHVLEARGVYRWDCSGMVNWVLARSSRRALRGLGRERPLAMTYARVITRAPTDTARRGWQRVQRVADVRPGDIFAWESPARFRRYATGHVGFVVRAPERVRDDLWAMRIVDSTTGPHQADTRSWDMVGGTGYGTMTFQTDARGHVISYGWWGTRSPAYIGARVVFGRPR